MASPEEIDINTIPLTAPLSIPEPPKKWIYAQNHKGTNRNREKLPAVDLSGRWIIISGANNGIGREAALQFASWGANIVLACRPNAPAWETKPEDVVAECKARAPRQDAEIEYWELDCADLGSVEDFAIRWLKTDRALDVLCNNAGMGSSPGGNKPFLTKDGFEIIHQVNFLSHVLLTLRLLPSLAKATAPRVVCTTSCFHYFGKFDLSNCNGEKGGSGQEGVQYYQNNKLWFQVWLTELQRRLLQHEEYRHITIQGVHPGYVNSGIWNVNRKHGWLDGIIEWILKLAAWFMGIDMQQGSLAIVNAATQHNAGPDPEVQGVGEVGGKGGGRYFNRIWEETPMPHTKNADCRQRVWRKVNEELKLEEKGLLKVLGLEYEEGKVPMKALLDA